MSQELARGRHLVRCPGCGGLAGLAGEDRLARAAIASHEAPVERDAKGQVTAWRPCPARGRPVALRYVGGGQFTSEVL